jgi:hypothetical protein
MSRVCSTYAREQKDMQGFDGGNLREGVHFEDPDIDGSIILKWIFEKWDGEHGRNRCGLG